MSEQSEAKGQILLKWLDEGREFTTEILKENERLRLLLASLKSEINLQKLSILGEEKVSPEKLSEVEAEKKRQQEELERLRENLKEVEAENQVFADQYVKVEEQNQNMASLYVASLRLHSTLEFENVIEIIKEIIINLIGSEIFAIFLRDPGAGELQAVAGEGMDIPKVPPIKLGVGIAGKAAQSGEHYVAEGPPVNENDPIACVPLKVQDELMGMIAIYKLLSQKSGFEEIDLELFGLLADHAAASIYSSQLHSLSKRKITTIQNFLEQLKLGKIKPDPNPA